MQNKTADNAPGDPVAADKTGRRFVRHLILGLLVAIGISVWLRVLSGQNQRPGAFDLRPHGVALVLDGLFLIALVEIPVVLFSVGFEHMGARRSLQTLAKLFFLVPLMAISWHLLLAKFHTVYVEDDTIAVEGNSTWADDAFKIAKIDRIEIHRGKLWDELLFIWFDKIDASGGIWRFDRHAQEELDRLLAKLRERGINYREVARR
jgi:hypothetical protein